MLALIEQNRAVIESLCRKYGVRRLDIFGSATTQDFDVAKSDIDLLVEFNPDYDLGPWMKHYFELRDSLATVLGREVDLVMADSVTNPYLVQAIQDSRRPIYAPEIPQTA